MELEVHRNITLAPVLIYAATQTHKVESNKGNITANCSAQSVYIYKIASPYSDQ